MGEREGVDLAVGGRDGAEQEVVGPVVGGSSGRHLRACYGMLECQRKICPFRAGTLQAMDAHTAATPLCEPYDLHPKEAL